jgi:hypothetical protein
MARNPKYNRFNGDGGKKQKKNSFGVEFINLTLTEKEKDGFEAWQLKEPRTIDELFDMLVFDEYKVTISVDKDNECYLASVTGKERSHNPGMCMVSRSDNLKEVVALAVYKALYFFPDGIWEVEELNRPTWG